MNQPQVICHSPYQDFDKLKSTLKNSKNQFSIFITNIQSVRAKINELNIFVESLKNINYSFSAICIQETWLEEGEDTSQLELDGYILISQGKYCNQKGGLIIYLKNKFEYTIKHILKYKTWEGQIIQVKKGEHLSKPINIGNIYIGHQEICWNIIGNLRKNFLQY